MQNFKSISFKMAVLQGGGQNLPSPCLCYPKTPCGIGLSLVIVALFFQRIEKQIDG